MVENYNKEQSEWVEKLKSDMETTIGMVQEENELVRSRMTELQDL